MLCYTQDVAVEQVLYCLYVDTLCVLGGEDVLYVVVDACSLQLEDCFFSGP